MPAPRPVRHRITAAAHMPTTLIEMDQIVRSLEREIRVAHDLQAEVVEAVQGVRVVARPGFEGGLGD